MFCRKCGTQLPEDASFCSQCGAAMNSTTSAPEASQQDEHVVCEFPVNAILYDGKPNFLTSCACTITDHRLILDSLRGSNHQAYLRDITQVSPEIRWSDHRVSVKAPGKTYALSG